MRRANKSKIILSRSRRIIPDRAAGRTLQRHRLGPGKRDGGRGLGVPVLFQGFTLGRQLD